MLKSKDEDVIYKNTNVIKYQYNKSIKCKRLASDIKEEIKVLKRLGTQDSKWKKKCTQP